MKICVKMLFAGILATAMLVAIPSQAQRGGQGQQPQRSGQSGQTAQRPGQSTPTQRPAQQSQPAQPRQAQPSPQPQQAQRPQSTQQLQRAQPTQQAQRPGQNQPAQPQRVQPAPQAQRAPMRGGMTSRPNVQLRPSNPSPLRGPFIVRQPRTRIINSFYGFRAYSWHPFVPFYWGPSWHPVGWFTAALATTAMMLSINSAQFGPQYFYYDNGVFFAPATGGFSVIAAPVGAVIPALPYGYTTTIVNNMPYYYYGGTFYTMTPNRTYQVIRAPQGAIVGQLPQGAQQINVQGNSIMEYGGAYYQPIMQNNESAYEVVSVM